MVKILDYYFQRLMVFIEKNTTHHSFGPQYAAWSIFALTLICNFFALLDILANTIQNRVIIIVLSFLILIIIGCLTYYIYVYKKRYIIIHDKCYISNILIRIILDIVMFFYFIFSFWLIIS